MAREEEERTESSSMNKYYKDLSPHEIAEQRERAARHMGRMKTKPRFDHLLNCRIKTDLGMSPWTALCLACRNRIGPDKILHSGSSANITCDKCDAINDVYEFVGRSGHLRPVK